MDPTLAPTTRPAPPQPEGRAGLLTLQALLRPATALPNGRPLAALQALHRELGDVFQVAAFGFRPVVMVGPEAARFVFMDQAHNLLWRNEDDAIAKLLGHGLLVADGGRHDHPLAIMKPALTRRALPGYAPAMIHYTDQVSDAWPDGSQQDLLDEVRRIALLVIFDTLFGIDITPDLEELWNPVKRALAYIGPGAWLLWPDMPRRAFRRPLAHLDSYLHDIIGRRRAALLAGSPPTTMLDQLLLAPDVDDTVVRDQMLTMVIAGHDTSTSLLVWSLYLLGAHPDVLAAVQEEVDRTVGTHAPSDDHLRDLPLLNQVVQETMRLYPPAHASMRKSTADLEFDGYHIPAGSRIMLSIYLTHRHPQHWDRPDEFLPERFAPDAPRKPAAHSFIPFGGGQRTCLGASYGRMEVKLILARLLQKFNLTLAQRHLHVHMGAALEPRPGLPMRVARRSRT